MFNFLKKFRKSEEISRTDPGFEESERRTPKAGIILLLIMFVAALFFGWRAMDDLSRVPKAPEPLSSCSYRFQTGQLRDTPFRPYEPPPLYDEKETYYDDIFAPPYYGEDYSRCRFSEIERAHKIPELFTNKLKPLETQRQALLGELRGVDSSIRSVQTNLQRAIQEYGVGLEEIEEQIKNPLFPLTPSQQRIRDLKNQEAQLTVRKNELQSRVDGLNAEVKKAEEEVRAAYKPVMKEQNRALRWFDFKVFLLQFLFVLPFFIFSFRGYLRLHRKNSPYTVIVLAILAVAGILLLRVILVWFWDLFLAQVIETFLRWFAEFKILRSIFFYLGMALSFLIFGGAVYLLQKKIFDPRRVTIRRFRAKQCPQCQTNLDLAVNFCPNCGRQVKARCEQCGQARFIGLPSCPFCGKKSA